MYELNKSKFISLTDSPIYSVSPLTGHVIGSGGSKVVPLPTKQGKILDFDYFKLLPIKQLFFPVRSPAGINHASLW